KLAHGPKLVVRPLCAHVRRIERQQLGSCPRRRSASWTSPCSTKEFTRQVGDTKKCPRRCRTRFRPRVTTKVYSLSKCLALELAMSRTGPGVISCRSPTGGYADPVAEARESFSRGVVTQQLVDHWGRPWNRRAVPRSFCRFPGPWSFAVQHC